MTAEIAIVNQSAVALAADSAVTIGRDRVWKTTNKLFSLSPANDIGIMIYGAADFISYPWETIIKLFRTAHKDTRFDHVIDCKEALFEFLKTDLFGDSDMQGLSSSYLILSLLSELGDKLEKKPALRFRTRLKARIKKTKSCYGGKGDNRRPRFSVFF